MPGGKLSPIEIILRAFDAPITARELTNIIYDMDTDESSLAGTLDGLVAQGVLTKKDSSSGAKYSIANKDHNPQYFYVFQNKSFDEEYKGGFLWAPKKGKGTATPHHWSRMEDVKKGDVILHGYNGTFVAVSIAKADCYSAPRPNKAFEEWAMDGWRIDSDYFVFPHSIKPADYTEELGLFLPEKYSPFNREGGGNQGYLYEANKDMAQYLIDAVAGMAGEPVKVPTTPKAKKEDDQEEAFSLLEEKPQSQLENLIKAFKNNLKEYQADYVELEALRKAFENDYNMKRLMDMKKEDYVIGLERQDTFCYRIENELKRLGDIHGAPSTKFGLYYGALGDDKEDKYRLQSKFGEDIDAGFDEIKKEIVYLRMAGDSEDYDRIRECQLWPLFRGKILSTFYPEKYLAIFAKEHLTYFLTKLGMKPTSEDVLDMQIQLLDWKKNQDQLKDLNNYLFMRFLYASFGRPFEKDSSAQDAQDQRDKEYPRDYVSKINITISQWKDLLRDPEVFKENDIELLKRFYMSDNHAATCYDLGVQDGVSPSTYIKPVVALARRVQDKMSLPPVLGTDGKETWWRILFWGQYREDGHFEWKVRPKLAKAMAALYPELEADEINDEEDEKLVTDLKQARLINAKEDFEYEGKPKEKPAAVYVSGHKTYPRDRQIAINALAHAHYLCEIDNEHITFIRRNSDKPYTEPHHLIPMAFSDEFDVSLDIEENIVSLCSNCHNQIHYGKDAEVLLKKLYDERKDALKKAGISITFKRLLSMYNIQSNEEEEE